MRLTDYSGGKIVSGEINFSTGENSSIDLAKQNQQIMGNVRGNDISMIFQEPMTSLNPVYTIGMQISEAIINIKVKPKTKLLK